jgi:putative membrane protein
MTHEPAANPDSNPVNPASRLAFERTFLAHERTQLAWIRTALALISFGFGIAKAFEFMREKLGDHATRLTPRTVGILMISLGIFGMVVATFFHGAAVRKLRKECPELPFSPAIPMAVLLGILGITALVEVLLRT